MYNTQERNKSYKNKKCSVGSNYTQNKMVLILLFTSLVSLQIQKIHVESDLFGIHFRIFRKTGSIYRYSTILLTDQKPIFNFFELANSNGL